MKSKPRINVTSLVCLSGLVFLLAATVAAQTSAPDVGLITKLSGEATYWNEAGKKEPAKVQAFMKVRQGDHFRLPESVALTLLYFTSGRQETWKGPATLIAGGQESAAPGGKQPTSPPEVKMLPAKASSQIMGLTLAKSSTSKAGVIQTMGGATKAAAPSPAATPLSTEGRQAIKEADRYYRHLRKKAGADDVTPELYYLSVLRNYQQYPEMEKFMDSLLLKRPGDPALEQLRAWVRSQVKTGN